MKVKIETATTCLSCGIHTSYVVKENRDMTPQIFLNIKLAILSELTNCQVVPDVDIWHKTKEGWQLIVMGIPMINGKRQGATSVWFTIKDVWSKEKATHQPSYSEVMSRLSASTLHRCFEYYEVLGKKRASASAIEAAKSYLKDVADSYQWHYDIFIDIIDEEYVTIYDK